MDPIHERIVEMGFKLPSPFVYPSNNRTGCIEVGNLLYTSGHPPPSNFGVRVHGKVGASVTEEEAVQSAHATSLNILASVKKQLNSLERIKKVIKITGMVNSAPGFDRQFAVIDGASNFYYSLFGEEAGQHARSAIGVFELPRQFCMEIEAIFEISQ
jgi:enamine deaminase RidA (YjgF/YER057c/UK114 family)